METITIDSRENSTLASAWWTYLCLEVSEDQKVSLCVRGYEVLCEVRELLQTFGEVAEEDDFDIYDHLPEEYDGKKVDGIEDGEFLVGGDLVETGNEGDDEVLEIEAGNQEEIRDYLERHGWDASNLSAILKQAAEPLGEAIVLSASP